MATVAFPVAADASQGAFGSVPQKPGVEDEREDSEEARTAEDVEFDYVGLEEAQRIAGDASGDDNATRTEDANASAVKRKQRGGCKASRKRRKQQRRAEDLARAMRLAAMAPPAQCNVSIVMPAIARGSASTVAQDLVRQRITSAALSLPGQTLQGSQDPVPAQVVARAQKEAARRARVTDALAARTAFVTNVPKKVTERELREWLGVGNSPCEIRLARHKTTTQALGYAHVLFDNSAAMLQAVSRCDRAELMGRIVRMAPAGKDAKIEFELPSAIRDDICALMREAYEGKNISTIKDAWQKRHDGQKLDVSKWGFKNFSAALQTIEGVALERHSEKTLTLLAFFKDSPTHAAHIAEKYCKANDAESVSQSLRKSPINTTTAASGVEAPDRQKRPTPIHSAAANVKRRTRLWVKQAARVKAHNELIREDSAPAPARKRLRGKQVSPA